MASSWMSTVPAAKDFIPPTPQAFSLLSVIFSKVFPACMLLTWTPIRKYQAMGKTSTNSSINLPGRYAWAIAESVGPLNLLFIMYTLPSHLRGLPQSTGLFGTGLPIQNEIMGVLYVVHYLNRAIIVPLFLAPSMSPIHPIVSFAMATFQFVNSSSLACWLTYSALPHGNTTPVLSMTSLLGMSLWVGGLAGNIIAETSLFDLRRGAAKRKAKSEGRASITYDKVYAIPPAQGLFRHILFPHYSLEWIEWIGYAILGGAWGLGWTYGQNAGMWFVVNEIGSMASRAWTGVEWYTQKFGTRAVGGRKAVIPGLL